MQGDFMMTIETFVIFSIYLYGATATPDGAIAGSYVASRYSQETFATERACFDAIRRSGRDPAVVTLLENTILVCRKGSLSR